MTAGGLLRVRGDLSLCLRVNPSRSTKSGTSPSCSVQAEQDWERESGSCPLLANATAGPAPLGLDSPTPTHLPPVSLLPCPPPLCWTYLVSWHGHSLLACTGRLWPSFQVAGYGCKMLWVLLRPCVPTEHVFCQRKSLHGIMP